MRGQLQLHEAEQDEEEQQKEFNRKEHPGFIGASAPKPADAVDSGKGDQRRDVPGPEAEQEGIAQTQYRVITEQAEIIGAARGEQHRGQKAAHGGKRGQHLGVGGQSQHGNAQNQSDHHPEGGQGGEQFQAGGREQHEVEHHRAAAHETQAVKGVAAAQPPAQNLHAQTGQTYQSQADFQTDVAVPDQIAQGKSDAGQKHAESGVEHGIGPQPAPDHG